MPPGLSLVRLMCRLFCSGGVEGRGGGGAGQREHVPPAAALKAGVPPKTEQEWLQQQLPRPQLCPAAPTTHQVEALDHDAREARVADHLQHRAALPLILARRHHDLCKEARGWLSVLCGCCCFQAAEASPSQPTGCSLLPRRSPHLVAAEDAPLAALKHGLEALAVDAHPGLARTGCCAHSTGCCLQSKARAAAACRAVDWRRRGWRRGWRAAPMRLAAMPIVCCCTGKAAQGSGASGGCRKPWGCTPQQHALWGRSLPLVPSCTSGV